MLRWLLDQSILVQFAIILPPVVVGGVLLHTLVGKRPRLLRRAERAAGRAVSASSADGPPVRTHWVTGAVDVDPGVLAIVFHYTDDATLAAAEASGATARLRDRTLDALRQTGYPSAPGSISFVSDETVEREGGPAVYFR